MARGLLAITGADDMPEPIRRALLRQLGGKEADTTRAHPLAQMEALQQRWDASREPSMLKPGDLCLEKDGFKSYREAVNGPLVYMVWCPFDQFNYLHIQFAEDFQQQFGPMPHVDVIVAYMDSESHQITYRPHRLSHLRALTAEERSGLDQMNAMDGNVAP